jgi:hypothetical protein
MSTSAANNALNNSRYNSYLESLELSLLSFDSVKEWPDLIQSLQKVQKVIENKKFGEINIIPPSLIINLTKRLGQCLNSGLPNGVHIKCLELLIIIFNKIGEQQIVTDLSLYSAGLFQLFYYSSTKVKPVLLTIFETYYLPLGRQLLPCLEGLISAVISGLEDDNNEYYNRCLLLINNIKQAVNHPAMFYNCIWSSLLMNSNIRLATVNYLSVILPKNNFSALATYIPDSNLTLQAILACINDSGTTILAQRKLFELVLNSFPLNEKLSTAFNEHQIIQLTYGLLKTVLKQDISLTRRLFTWIISTNSNSKEGKNSVTFSSSLNSPLPPNVSAISSISPYTVNILHQTFLHILSLANNSNSKGSNSNTNLSRSLPRGYQRLRRKSDVSSPSSSPQSVPAAAIRFLEPFRILSVLLEREEINFSNLFELLNLALLEHCYGHSSDLHCAADQLFDFYTQRDLETVFTDLSAQLSADCKANSANFPQLHLIQLVHFCISFLPLQETLNILPLSSILRLLFQSLVKGAGGAQLSLLQTTCEALQKLVSTLPKLKETLFRAEICQNAEEQAEISEETLEHKLVIDSAANACFLASIISDLPQLLSKLQLLIENEAPLALKTVHSVFNLFETVFSGQFEPCSSSFAENSQRCLADYLLKISQLCFSQSAELSLHALLLFTHQFRSISGDCIALHAVKPQILAKLWEKLSCPVVSLTERFSALFISLLSDPNYSEILEKFLETTPSDPQTRNSFYSRLSLLWKYPEFRTNNRLWLLLNTLTCETDQKARLIGQNWAKNAISEQPASILDPILSILLDNFTRKEAKTYNYRFQFDIQRVFRACLALEQLILADLHGFFISLAVVPPNSATLELYCVQELSSPLLLSQNSFLSNDNLLLLALQQVHKPGNYLFLAVLTLLRLVQGNFDHKFDPKAQEINEELRSKAISLIISLISINPTTNQHNSTENSATTISSNVRRVCLLIGEAVLHCLHAAIAENNKFLQLCLLKLTGIIMERSQQSQFTENSLYSLEIFTATIVAGITGSVNGPLSGPIELKQNAESGRREEKDEKKRDLGELYRTDNSYYAELAEKSLKKPLTTANELDGVDLLWDYIDFVLFSLNHMRSLLPKHITKMITAINAQIRSLLQATEAKKVANIECIDQDNSSLEMLIEGLKSIILNSTVHTIQTQNAILPPANGINNPAIQLAADTNSLLSPGSSTTSPIHSNSSVSSLNLMSTVSTLFSPNIPLKAPLKPKIIDVESQVRETIANLLPGIVEVLLEVYHLSIPAQASIINLLDQLFVRSPAKTTHALIKCWDKSHIQANILTVLDSCSQASLELVLQHTIHFAGTVLVGRHARKTRPIDSTVSATQIASLTSNQISVLNFLYAYIEKTVHPVQNSHWPLLAALFKEIEPKSDQPYITMWAFAILLAFVKRLKQSNQSSQQNGNESSGDSSPAANNSSSLSSSSKEGALSRDEKKFHKELQILAIQLLNSIGAECVEALECSSPLDALPLPLLNYQAMRVEEEELLPPLPSWLKLLVNNNYQYNRPILDELYPAYLLSSPPPSSHNNVWNNAFSSLSPHSKVQQNGPELISPAERSKISGSLDKSQRLQVNTRLSLVALRLLSNLITSVLDEFFPREEDRDRVYQFLQQLINSNFLPILQNNSHPYNFIHVTAIASFLSSLTTNRYSYTMKAWKSGVWSYFESEEFFVSDLSALEQWRWVITRIVSEDKYSLTNLLDRSSPNSLVNYNVFTSKDTEIRERARLIRKFTFILAAGRRDQYARLLHTIVEKLVESLKFTVSSNNLNSSNAAAIYWLHNCVFLCIRVLLYRVSAEHFISVWPHVLQELIRILRDHQRLIIVTIEPNIQYQLYSLLLSAIKFIDLALVCLPTEFNLYSWMFVENFGSSTSSIATTAAPPANQGKSNFVPHLKQLAETVLNQTSSNAVNIFQANNPANLIFSTDPILAQPCSANKIRPVLLINSLNSAKQIKEIYAKLFDAVNRPTNNNNTAALVDYEFIDRLLLSEFVEYNSVTSNTNLSAKIVAANVSNPTTASSPKNNIPNA